MAVEFGFCDDLGPAKVVQLYETGSGLKAFVVVDNVARGPAIGGVRMAADVTVEECFRLARAMTLKNAAAGLKHGGGKAAIVADHRLPPAEKERLVRAFANAIRDLVDYIPGPDMGTDERCMAWVHDEIGRSVGLPAALGGVPLDEIGATGFGLAVAGEVAQDFCDVALEGARVAVQGFGSVGQHAARYLAERGARLVAAADSHATLVDSKGLDIQALIALKRGGGNLDKGAGKILPPEAVIEADCDIWIPAARPDVIRADNVERLKARLVLQGANIAVTAEAEEALHRRGVLSVPDFIANAGGVISAAVEYAGGGARLAFETIDEKIRANTREVLTASRDKGETPRAAATALARARVEAAMSFRRWS